jgi:Raf kinase inhibitor-like YbhB/YbcL family protein
MNMNGKKMRRLVAGILVAMACAARLFSVHAADAGKSLQVTSPSFDEGQDIPAVHACDGRNISPALKWSGAPKETRGFALICDDPDAPGGTWVHWVLYGLPASVTELPENVPPVETPSVGGLNGINSFNHLGYGGPCPPPGKPHHYHFRIYALDADVGLKPKASRADLDKAMKGHILAEGELMGTY